MSWFDGLAPLFPIRLPLGELPILPKYDGEARPPGLRNREINPQSRHEDETNNVAVVAALGRCFRGGDYHGLRMGGR